MCRALPGFHALTGCDSTSSFVGKGKSQAFKLLLQNPQVQLALQQLGQRFDPPDFSSLASACEAVVCALYGSALGDINAVRYALFCSKASDSSQLPPTRDALQLHICRANYQAGIWHRCLISEPDVPRPEQHGWVVTHGVLQVLWMNQPPAPPDVLQLLSCKCQTSCKSQRCSCVKGGLPCTDVCGCTGCQNENRGNAAELGSDADQDEGEDDAVDASDHVAEAE